MYSGPSRASVRPGENIYSSGLTIKKRREEKSFSFLPCIMFRKPTGMENTTLVIKFVTGVISERHNAL